MSSTELSGYSLVKLDEISWPTFPPQLCLRTDKPNTSVAAMVIELGEGRGGGLDVEEWFVCVHECVCRGVWIGGGEPPSVSCSSIPFIDEEPRRSFSLKLPSTLWICLLHSIIPASSLHSVSLFSSLSLWCGCRVWESWASQRACALCAVGIRATDSWSV